MDCPDCYGQETSEDCFRCDGSGELCDRCGESTYYCRGKCGEKNEEAGPAGDVQPEGLQAEHGKQADAP